MLWLADYLPVNIPIGIRQLGLYSVARRPISWSWWNQLKRWIPKMEFLHGKCGASSPWYSHPRPVGSFLWPAETGMVVHKGSFYGNLNPNDIGALKIKGNTPNCFESPVKVRTLLFSTENMTAKALECFLCRCDRLMCTKSTLVVCLWIYLF